LVYDVGGTMTDKFNAILVKKRKPSDLKKIEKIIDDEKKRINGEEKIKNAIMDEKIHAYNPNKY